MMVGNVYILQFHLNRFTCPDTLAASHLNVAVTGPGQVANHAEQLKIDK